MMAEKKTGIQPTFLFWLVGLGVLAADQLSKIWVEKVLVSEYGVIQIIPAFFRLVYARNNGIAFGLFQGNNLLIGLLGLAILAAAWKVGHELDWKKRETNLLAGLIIGGAVGNLINRFRLGYVVDFIEFYINAYSWPAFNIADTCISISMVYIFFRLWRLESASSK